MINKRQQFDNAQEFGWWIEILTNKPMYMYYFGFFNSYWEAEFSKNGYIEDLQKEGAEIVNIKIEKCQPKQLTFRVFVQYLIGI